MNQPADKSLASVWEQAQVPALEQAQAQAQVPEQVPVLEQAQVPALASAVANKCKSLTPRKGRREQAEKP
jgi:hypothetical protein